MILVVLQEETEGSLEGGVPQFADSEGEEGAGPVDRFRHGRSLAQIEGTQSVDETRGLLTQLRVELGDPSAQNLRLGGGIGEVEKEIEASTFQGVGEVAGAIRGKDDDGALAGLDRSQLGNRYLELSEDLEKEGFEFLVRLVHLINEEHGRAGGGEGSQQGAFEEKLPGKDVLGDVLPAEICIAIHLNPQQLLLVVPFVEGPRLVEPLVALQADEIGLEPLGQNLADLGLAGAGRALEKQRFFHSQGKEERGLETGRGHVTGVGKELLEFRKGGSHVPGESEGLPLYAAPYRIAGRGSDRDIAEASKGLVAAGTERMEDSRPTLYVIDASSFVYRAFHALPPLTSPAGVPVNAVYGFTVMLVRLLREHQPRLVAAVFDAPGPTFRAALFPEYKAHRPPMPEELSSQWSLVHEITAAFGLRSFVIPGVEADDVIGTLARQAKAEGTETVIVSADKDLLQLVGPGVRVWDSMKDRWFDEAAVEAKFGVRPDQIVDLLSLVGDTSDNIPGVAGVGEKTAQALLRAFGSLEEILAHPEEVARLEGLRGAKRVAEKLRAEVDNARLSHELAQVRTDVPLGLTIDELVPRPDLEAMRTLFTRLGFQKLVRDLPGGEEQASVDFERIDTKARLEAFLVEAEAKGAVAVRTPFGERAEAGSMWSASDRVAWVPADLAGPAEVVSRLMDHGVVLVTHDLKGEIHRWGNPVVDTAECFDVMLASYLSEVSASHRLEDVAADTLGLRLTENSDRPQDLVAVVQAMAALEEPLRQRMEDQSVGPLFRDVEMPLVGVLARMEARGVGLDVPALQRLGNELEGRQTSLEAEIHELAGGPFLIGSPAQLRDVLFGRLGLSTRGVRRGKTGLSTDVDVLTRLAEVHPLPAKILEYRSLAKLRSTYVDALPAAVNPATGRLHTTFNQAVTATGRLSSSAPNLQNIPVRGVEGRRIREAFVAGQGKCLLSADYSQIELRVLAHLSGDERLIHSFLAGEDIHARTAAEVFDVMPELITPVMRRAAKAINFGIVYGMGAASLARDVGVSIAEADRYIAGYFARYPGVRDYLESVRAAARRDGYVCTLLGRRRTIAEIASTDRHLAQAAERTAINTPIQGSAADLLKVAMVRIEARLRALALPAEMLLQVHDELVFEVAREQVEELRQLVKEEMQGALSLRVPLVVDVGVGSNWAEAHG